MEDQFVRIERLSNEVLNLYKQRERKGKSKYVDGTGYGAVNEPKDSAEQILEKRERKIPKNREHRPKLKTQMEAEYVKLKNKKKEMVTKLKVMREIVQNMKEEVKAEKQCLQQMICMVEGLKEVKDLSGTEPAGSDMTDHNPLSASVEKYIEEVAMDEPHNHHNICLLEGAMNIEDVTCNFCQLTKDLMEKLNVEVKSPVKISDFGRLDEDYKKNNGSSVPSYLDYVVRGIKIDITANTTFSDDILVLPRALFYAAIDEMHNMQLQEINEDVILRWGFVINNAHKMDLDVEFAKKHLKKIIHAYFTWKGPANDMEDLHTLLPQSSKSEATVDEMEKRFLKKSRRLNFKKCEICVDEADLFNHGEPLSKGILQPN